MRILASNGSSQWKFINRTQMLALLEEILCVTFKLFQRVTVSYCVPSKCVRYKGVRRGQRCLQNLVNLVCMFYIFCT